jgi:hypothetical protein
LPSRSTASTMRTAATGWTRKAAGITAVNSEPLPLVVGRYVAPPFPNHRTR